MLRRRSVETNKSRSLSWILSFYWSPTNASAETGRLHNWYKIYLGKETRLRCKRSSWSRRCLQKNWCEYYLHAFKTGIPGNTTVETMSLKYKIKIYFLTGPPRVKKYFFVLSWLKLGWYWRSRCRVSRLTITWRG